MGVLYQTVQQGRKANRRGGFTVIEVVLFLGITGMLAVGLLGGWTTMINTQRYKDSVKTLQSFIQQQYGLVYNVENGRSPTLSCTGGNVADGGVTSARGQSDCVLMGRFIQIEDGTKLTVRAIVGRDLPDDSVAASDIGLINSSTPSLIPEDIDIGLTYSSLTVPWGATIVDDDGDPLSMSIAIIRAPANVSGSVHTYTVTDGRPLSGMIAVANERVDVPMCLDAGNNFTGGNMGVVIKARASSQSYIQVITDGEGIC